MSNVDLSILWQPAIILLSGGIIAILECAGRLELDHKPLKGNWKWRLALPVLPLVMGVLGALLPGVLPDSHGWGEQVIVGLWAGLVAVQGRKVVVRWFIDKKPVQF